MPNRVLNEVRLFADDTKLFCRSDNPNGVEKLQNDLNEIQNWSDEWLLKFHPKKTLHLRPFLLKYDLKL